MTIESRNLHTIEMEMASDSLHVSETEKSYLRTWVIMSLNVYFHDRANRFWLLEVQPWSKILQEWKLDF